MDWTVYPQSSYIEAVTPNMTVFGDMPLGNYKVKWDNKGKVLIQ